VFLSGGGSFTVPFDGNKLIWTVKSFKNNGQKGAVASQASSNSSRCNKSEAAEAPAIPVDETGDLKIYPNPTAGKVYIDLGAGTVTLKDIVVYDIYGKALQAPVSHTSSDQLELDLSGYKAGLYVVRINTGETVKTMQIIKK
jgi:hypothetical protein